MQDEKEKPGAANSELREKMTGGDGKTMPGHSVNVKDLPPPIIPMNAAALAYANKGKAVFPCRLDKRPYTAHGLKDATSDPAQVQAFWDKYPGASIGLPTGPENGFFVLDVDLPDGPGTLARLEDKNSPLPETLQQKTGGGGDQYFFKWNGAEIRNSAGKLGPGLDVRGMGGYVIAPPSGHPSGGSYEWISKTEPAPAPSWLVDMIISKPAKATAPLNISDKTSPYGAKALQDEAAKVALAQEGQRNKTLFDAALAIGNLIGGGHIDQGEAESVLLHAGTRAGLEETPAIKTIASGLEKGMQNPRGPEPEKSEIRKLRNSREDGNPDGSKVFAEFANSQGTISNDDEWNDLLLIPEWPEIDDQAMPGAIREFVELASRNSEADRAAILGSFFVGFSAQCGPSSFLQVGDTSHFPRINVVVCGASSKARKGTSYGPVSRLFRPMDNLWIPAQTSPGPLSTGEGLVYRVRDERKQEVTDKKTGQTKVEVVDPGVTDKRLLVVDQELAAALNSMKRQGNTLSTIIRSLWDSGNCDPLTKNNPIKCTDAHVCILCHITIAELIKLIDDVELLNGLANRKLWILARRGDPVPFPEPMPREELDPLRRYFQHNAEKARVGGEMTLTASAKELWASVYPELSRDHEGIVGSVLNRMEAQALRLSMVYALATGSNLIEEKHIQQSMAFLDYCKQSTIKIFTKKADDGLQGKIIEALKSGPLDRTGLHRAMNNHAKARDLKGAIKKLCEKGVIVAKEDAPNGKVIFSLANLRKVRKPRNHKAPDIRANCEECEFPKPGPEQAPAPDVEVF